MNSINNLTSWRKYPCSNFHLTNVYDCITAWMNNSFQFINFNQASTENEIPNHLLNIKIIGLTACLRCWKRNSLKQYQYICSMWMRENELNIVRRNFVQSKHACMHLLLFLLVLLLLLMLLLLIRWNNGSHSRILFDMAVATAIKWKSSAIICIPSTCFIIMQCNARASTCNICIVVRILDARTAMWLKFRSNIEFQRKHICMMCGIWFNIMNLLFQSIFKEFSLLHAAATYL